MQVIRIILDLPVGDIDAARSFYTEFLGLADEEFNLGWVARFTAPQPSPFDARTRIQVVTRDAGAPIDAVASILTTDVESAYAEARERGYEIVHPLTTEAWGVRRFFVRAPDGNVFNVVAHED